MITAMSKTSKIIQKAIDIIQYNNINNYNMNIMFNFNKVYINNFSSKQLFGYRYMSTINNKSKEIELIESQAIKIKNNANLLVDKPLKTIEHKLLKIRTSFKTSYNKIIFNKLNKLNINKKMNNKLEAEGVVTCLVNNKLTILDPLNTWYAHFKKLNKIKQVKLQKLTMKNEKFKKLVKHYPTVYKSLMGIMAMKKETFIKNFKYNKYKQFIFRQKVYMLYKTTITRFFPFWKFYQRTKLRKRFLRKLSTGLGYTTIRYNMRSFSRDNVRVKALINYNILILKNKFVKYSLHQKIFLQDLFKAYMFRIKRLKLIQLRSKVFTRHNSVYYWYGPRTSLLPAFTTNEIKSLNLESIKNTYHYGRLKPFKFLKVQSKMKVLAGLPMRLVIRHYWLRQQSRALYHKNIKRSRILDNLFSLDHKVLRFWLHRIEKLVYKRCPYKAQTYKTNFLFPKYANYRFLFRNQLTEQQTFRWLYRLSYDQLVKMYKKTLHFTKRKFELAFVKYLEFRLDMLLYRLNMVWSLPQARRWISQGFFMVNGQVQTWPKFRANVGDMIMPIPAVRLQEHPQHAWLHDVGLMYNSTRLFWRPIQKGQYPTNILFNERIPAALIMDNPNPFKIYNTRPLSIQFLTLSLSKFN